MWTDAPPPRRTGGLTDGVIAALWLGSVVLCCGFTAGPVILFMGATCRKRWWIVTGVIYGVIYAAALLTAIATTPASTPTEEFPDAPPIYGAAIATLAGVWFVAICQSALMIPGWLRWRQQQNRADHKGASPPPTPLDWSSPTHAEAPGHTVLPPTGRNPWSSGAPPTDAAEVASHARLDLNSGASPEIAALSGANEVIAAAIVSERTARGPFLSIDDFVARMQLPPHVIVPMLAASMIVPPGRPDPPPHRIVDT